MLMDVGSDCQTVLCFVKESPKETHPNCPQSRDSFALPLICVSSSSRIQVFIQIFIQIFICLRTMLDTVALSDDEPVKTSPVRARKRRGVAQGFKPKQVTLVNRISIRTILRRKVEGQCGCHASCFGPFHTNQNLFEQLADMRSRLSKLPKLEQDKEAPFPNMQHFSVP